MHPDFFVKVVQVEYFFLVQVEYLIMSIDTSGKGAVGFPLSKPGNNSPLHLSLLLLPCSSTNSSSLAEDQLVLREGEITYFEGGARGGYFIYVLHITLNVYDI